MPARTRFLESGSSVLRRQLSKISLNPWVGYQSFTRYQVNIEAAQLNWLKEAAASSSIGLPLPTLAMISTDRSLGTLRAVQAVPQRAQTASPPLHAGQSCPILLHVLQFIHNPFPQLWMIHTLTYIQLILLIR